MNYGPVEPLQDPKRAAALAKLLKKGGLHPIDCSVPISGHITLEVSPPSGFFAIKGITSRNTQSDGIHIIRAVINDYSVLEDVDAASFNLGHLIPSDLGVIGKGHPLVLNMSLRDLRSTSPDLALTLWGHRAPSYYTPTAPPREGLQLRLPDDMALIKALRHIRAHDIPVDDDELRALIDKYAAIL